MLPVPISLNPSPTERVAMSQQTPRAIFVIARPNRQGGYLFIRDPLPGWPPSCGSHKQDTDGAVESKSDSREPMLGPPHRAQGDEHEREDPGLILQPEATFKTDRFPHNYSTKAQATIAVLSRPRPLFMLAGPIIMHRDRPAVY